MIEEARLWKHPSKKWFKANRKGIWRNLMEVKYANVVVFGHNIFSLACYCNLDDKI
jgi:hypothetical protein